MSVRKNDKRGIRLRTITRWRICKPKGRVTSSLHVAHGGVCFSVLKLVADTAWYS